MVQIEVIQSPDKNVLAPIKYHQNLVYLGRTNGDLWIQDNELLPSHVMLEVIGKELLIHPQKDVEFYLLNGKRASQIRKLKINDKISIGNTIFKVIAFEETIRESKKDILNKKLAQLIAENAPRMNVVERLTKLMKQ